MPTNEERKEMAENLRIMCAYGCNYAEQFYDLLVETVMDEWDFRTFEVVADRLADLIYPEPVRTCRIISDSPNYGHCSECGAEYDYHDSDGIADELSGDPYYFDGAFCKRCGAMVVEP